ncbi:MAG TPA: FAD-dependent oxidoreductase [Conexibacter sp.]
MSGRRAHVAIVGSGPAGAYAAIQLLADGGGRVAIDLYDRLATPWGLVRAGVAPDHPKIKTVTRVFERLAGDPAFRFVGNVEIGRDVDPQQLARHYDAVLYAVGAAGDRRLGIPGEELPGSHPATAFVAWYNGHPDHADDVFDLSARRAVVVGNGNVALDCARMLALTPAELAATDTADHALAALADSAVEEIVVLGRRGPLQAAFTNPELRELVDLADAQVVVDPEELALDPASAALLADGGADTTAVKNLELLRAYAQAPPNGKRRRIVLRFGVSPVELVGREGRVAGVRVVRNELTSDGRGGVAARPTDRVETIDAGLVLRAVGYRGTPLPGVPFDARRATIHNAGGRVTDPASGAPLPGLYTAGWVKRGPSGVIGTNKKCAQETVALLLEDLAAGRLPARDVEPDALLAQLRDAGVRVVDFDGWRAIDAHERGLGEPHGRPRVKLVRRDEQLAHAGAAIPSHTEA